MKSKIENIIVFLFLLVGGFFIGFGLGQMYPNELTQEKYYRIGIVDGVKIVVEYNKGTSVDEALDKYYQYLRP